MAMYYVRDAHNYEVDKLAAIAGRVLAEAPTYTRLAFDHEKTANALAGAILKQDGWFLRVIADENDEPVGGIFGVCEEALTSRDKVAYDITMMIDKPHRGKCIRAFIQCCEDFRAWGIANGAKIVKLGVSSGIKIDSISNLLERLGFVRIGSMHAHIEGV